MVIAPPTTDEQQRLALLRSLDLLDSAPEPAFDAMTRLVCRLLAVPVALVSLVDKHRQWFKSRVGLDAQETSRDLAFCAHAIHQATPFVVPDARLDHRFADNPLVTGAPHVRAYAGIPLRSADGHALGTLCAIDHEPHVFSAEDLDLLQSFADVVRRELLHREMALRARDVAEQNLRVVSESEALYHATFDRAAIGMAIVGLDGHWLRLNNTLCHILGRSREALSGTTFQDVTHRDDLGIDVGHVHALLSGVSDHYAMEKRYVRPDGGIVWANLTVTLIRHDGRPLHFISVVEDITPRREAETALNELRVQLEQRVAERTVDLQRANDHLSNTMRQLQASDHALARSEADLRAVLEHAQDAFIRLDAMGVVMEWNRQAERMFGWRREEALGRRVNELIVPPAGRDRGLLHLARHSDDLVADQRIEVPCLCRDGRVIPCELTITSLPSVGRGPVHALFLHDISARKQAEQLLADSERRLNAVVHDQTDILCRFDPRGRLSFANATTRKMFMLDEQSIGVASWRTIVWPADYAEVAGRLRSLSADNPVVVTENRFVDHRGELRWAEFINRGVFGEDGALHEVQTVGRDVTDRKVLEARLADATERLQDLYDHAPCGYYSLDAQGRYLQANHTTLAWLGCTGDEVIGRLGPRDFFTDEGRALFAESFPRFLAEGRIGPLEFDLVGRDGISRRISVSASAVRDDAGRVQMSRSVMVDISETDRIKRTLQRLNREQALMLDNELVGIVKLRDRRVVWKNRALERMFDFPPGGLDGQPTRILYPDDAAYEAMGRDAYPAMRQGGTYRGQLHMVKRDGERLWVDVSGALLSEETGESLWLMMDVTAMKLYQQQVEHLAFHDPLTGLPNRTLLMDRLGQALSSARRTGELLAVCFLDLNGFKAVNDRHGHESGDRLLRAIGTRLQACVRGTDTVARLGGDEFVLVLNRLAHHDECRLVLDRVLNAVAEPVVLGVGKAAHVSASIGTAFHPADGAEAAALLEAADQAMYRVKQAGRLSSRG